MAGPPSSSSGMEAARVAEPVIPPSNVLSDLPCAEPRVADLSSTLRVCCIVDRVGWTSEHMLGAILVESCGMAKITAFSVPIAAGFAFCASQVLIWMV